MAERDTVAAVVRTAFPTREPTPSGTLRARGVLYLATSPGLTSSQFASISRGAEEIGDAWFYLSNVGRRVPVVPRLPPLSPLTPDDFQLDAHDYAAYLESAPASGASHILVSPRGVWGAYVHDLGVVVVAGDASFVSTVFADQPPSVGQAVLFMRDAGKIQRLNSWCAELIRNVLGPETAEQVLSKATV